MLIISLLINIIIFFLIFNMGYLNKKKTNPATPDKPLSQMYLFPIAIAILFTLIMDAFKGIFFYQMLVFVVTAILIYLLFYKAGQKK